MWKLALILPLLAGCNALTVAAPLFSTGKVQPLLHQVSVIAENEATKLDMAEEVDKATAEGRIYKSQAPMDRETLDQILSALLAALRAGS